MPSQLTPAAIGKLATAKPIHVYERGAPFRLLGLGDRLVFLSYIHDGNSYDEEAVFVVSTLAMQAGKLALTGEHVLEDTSISSAIAHDDTIWAAATQKGKAKLLVIATPASGAPKIMASHAIDDNASLVDVSADGLVLIKTDDTLEIRTTAFKELGTITPKWTTAEKGFLSAAVHDKQLVILGTDRSGLQIFDISDPKKPVQIGTVAGQQTSPHQIRWYPDGHVVAYGRSKVADVYRTGPKWKKLGRVKLANHYEQMIRVGDVCLFSDGRMNDMKNPEKDARKVDLIQLGGDKPAALPVVVLPVTNGEIQTTREHVHVLATEGVATFAL